MICASSFHFCLIDRLMILRNTLFDTYILWNFGMKFRPRGGVCNIPLLRALSELILWEHLLVSDSDYYTIGNLIVIMRQYGYDDMLFCCIDIDVFYWLVSPECIGFCTSKMHKNRWNPWTPNRVKEWTIGVWLLYIWQIYIWLDVMIMDFIFDMICWWCRLSIACRLDSHVE